MAIYTQLSNGTAAWWFKGPIRWWQPSLACCLATSPAGQRWRLQWPRRATDSGTFAQDGWGPSFPKYLSKIGLACSCFILPGDFWRHFPVCRSFFTPRKSKKNLTQFQLSYLQFRFQKLSQNCFWRTHHLGHPHVCSGISANSISGLKKGFNGGVLKIGQNTKTYRLNLIPMAGNPKFPGKQHFWWLKPIKTPHEFGDQVPPGWDYFEPQEEQPLGRQPFAFRLAQAHGDHRTCGAGYWATAACLRGGMEVTDTPRGGWKCWKWKDIKMFPPQKIIKWMFDYPLVN